MTIRTAIIGYGFAARTFHEPFLRHNKAFKLVAASGSNAAQAKALWPTVDCFVSVDELLDKSDADLFIIATPNDSHFTLAKHLLKKGKHLLIDKPVCTSVSELKQLQVLEAGSVSGSITVFQNRRWDGDFMTLKQLIKDEKVGVVKRFESHFDRARPTPQNRWREKPGDGAGIWFDLGPHLIDQTLQLFGKPNAISADIQVLRDGAKVDDYFDITLNYEDKVVKLNSSPFCYGPPLRFDLQGSHARFVKYGLDPQESKLIKQQAFKEENWAAEALNFYGCLYTHEGNDSVKTLEGSYETFFEELAGFIQRKNGNPVDLNSVADQLTLLELGIRASQTGTTMDLN